MRLKHLIVAALVATLASACGSDSNNPTTPSNPTKVIALSGTLTFGSVAVGSHGTAVMTIANGGNTALTVSSIAFPCGLGSQLTTSFTSGAIAPGGTQQVTLTFTPTVHTVCVSTITVAGDQTAGTNTIALSATGTLAGVPLFTVSGTGNATFALPAYMTKAQVNAMFNGATCHTFSMTLGVEANPFLFLNLGGCGEGAPSPFSGTAQWGGSGGTISVTNSDGVSWIFTEMRNPGDGDP